MPRHVIRPIPLTKIVGAPTYKMTHLVSFGSVQTRSTYVWYIERPKENILIDAGSSGEMKAISGHSSIMFSEGHMEQVQTPEKGLGKLGLKPEDIDMIIFTHLHHDHVEPIRKYPKARLIVQKPELDFARNPHPIQQFAYEPKMIEGLNFEVIEGDTQIVDGISVILTPGHSPGGQSIIVETAKGKAVISGLCCIRQNFEPPEELGLPVIPTGIHTDIIQSYDSLIKVKNIADIIIPIHDGEFLEVDRIP